jgi:hypothetical protein
MKYALVLATAGALTVALQGERSAAQDNSQAIGTEQLALSEQDKAVVILAALEAKSHQTTPKEFTPAVGALVPSALFIHAFNPEIARKVPALKHYWYAYLNGEIVLIDGIQRKVVAVIPLPAKVVSDGQQHHGAAEPQSASKPEDGAKSTGSVPAYTSPESIK